MPAQTTKPTFSGTFGAEGAAAAAKHGKAPGKVFGFQDLPPGIKNGTAFLIGAELRRYEDDTSMKQADGSSAKGQLYLRLVASVETPKTFQDNGTLLNLEGRQFSQMIPLCRKGAQYRGQALPDLDACIQVAASEIHLIAPTLDTSNMDAAIAALNNAKQKPRFLFETRELPNKTGKKDPKTGKPYPPLLVTNWLGSEGLAAAPVTGPADHVQAEPSANGTGAAPEQPFNEFANDAPDHGDLEKLAEMVDADDGSGMADQNSEVFKAAEKLGAAAEAAGITKADIEGKYSSLTWGQILDIMSKNAGGGPGDDEVEDEDDDDDVVEDEEAAAPKEWEKGDECEYVPLLANGKPGKRTVVCVITGLNKAKTKANVKEKAKPDVKYKDVPVDALTRLPAS